MPAARAGGRTPDFFVIGAPKAGTTSLYHWLREHPSIGMSPIKEPCFFAPEVIDYTPESRTAWEADAPGLREWLDGPLTTSREHGIVLDWDDYRSLFRHAGNALAVGEVSGNYLQSWQAPVGIRERIPDARIILMLRDPADRMFSHFTSAMAAGAVRGTFGDWIEEQRLAESRRDPPFGPIRTGMYATHLRRWRRAFPDAQIRVLFHEDFRADPDRTMRDLFEFLGVAHYPVDTTRLHNVTRVPRWPLLRGAVSRLRPVAAALLPDGVLFRAKDWYRTPPRFQATAAERIRLIDIYRDDILDLQTLTGRDLSAWLDVERNPTGHSPDREAHPHA